MFSVDDFMLAVPDAKLIGGFGKQLFSCAGIDSRKIAPGDMFFAIPGTFHDGHSFVNEAIRAGAKGVVIQEEVEVSDDQGVTIIRAADTLIALKNLAGFLRKQYNPLVLAVTGSVGKTTTKDLVAHGLGRHFKTIKSIASYNNQFGLPVTVCNISPDCTHLVLEIGANQVGEIDALAQLASPDVGIITNVGWAHVGSFGGLENTLASKTELVGHIKDGGFVIINGDDARLRGRVLSEDRLRVISCGRMEHNDLIVSDVVCSYQGTKGVIRTNGKAVPFAFDSVGEHMTYSAVFAVAAAIVCGLSLEEAVDSLSNFAPPRGRFFVEQLSPDVVLIDDSYNASPDAVIMALRSLQLFSVDNRIAVLGEMKELGEYTEKCHAEVGQQAAISTTHLIVAGSEDCNIIDSALKNGFPEERCIRAMSATDALSKVKNVLETVKGSVAVLIKGSRFTHMERVVLGLKDDYIGCDISTCPKYMNCGQCPDNERGSL